jgi:hypothetical protein
MTRILGVHGVGNHAPGHAPSDVARARSEAWAGHLAAGLDVPRERLDVRVAYYAHLLRVPVAQGPADEPTAEEWELVRAWLTELGAPPTVAQGRLTCLLRHAADWVARRFSLDGRVTQAFIAVFFREVAAYLREPGDVREGAREEVATAIAAHAPNIVVAHSLGSVVAYEALHAHPGLRVPLLLTLGSPLGLPFAVHERLRPAPVSGMGRRPAGVETWVNIADPGDPVAIPPRLARRFHGIAQDLTGTAGHLNPHAVAGYLRSATVAGALTFWLT